MLFCASAQMSVSAEAGKSIDAAPALDEILVTGVRPGPGLWRVSNGDHDLWILATLTPLPKGMTWRSQSVESRIASSQIVLAPPEITVDTSFFHDPRYSSAFANSRRAPNGQSLEQELPPKLYEQWTAMSEHYLGGGYDGHTRPMLAALDLFEHAVDKSGLSSNEDVWRLVLKTARSRHVLVSTIEIKMRLDNPIAWIREFNEIPKDQEVDCLQKTVERIETDLPSMRKRANLWSVGDIEGLRSMHYPNDRVTCFNALFSVPRLHAQLSQAESQLDNEWLTAAANALDKNPSSFAVLPIGELLKPDGWLDQLRSRGYAIQDPK